MTIKPQGEITMMTLDDIKNASLEEISEALLIWADTIPDKKNNFDAQLLIRASNIINVLDALLNLVSEVNKFKKMQNEDI